MTRSTMFIRILAAAALVAITACASASQPTAGSPPAPRSTGTLYHRLGGYDAIAAVVDDFLARMLGDRRRLAVFFENLNDAAKQRVRQMIVDQLCAASGGPCIYVAQDMRTAHQGMGITEADWNRAVGHLMVTLDRFRVPQREREELLAAISALKADIVGQ